MTDAARLDLPEEWTESAFERGTYGPMDREGLEAAFERDSMRVSVLPARYRREQGEESLRGYTRDLDLSKRSPEVFGEDVAPQTAFAVHVEYRPVSATRETIVCVAADADDALAVGVWLARASDDDAELGRNVDHHRGTQPATAGGGITDDDALAALFDDEADRCALTGRPSGSHDLTLPYRYYPLLEGHRTTARGVPRFPSDVASLAGVVSHTAWTERSLADVSFDAPLEREGAGSYALDADAAAVATDVHADAVTLRRLADA